MSVIINITDILLMRNLREVQIRPFFLILGIAYCEHILDIQYFCSNVYDFQSLVWMLVVEQLLTDFFTACSLYSHRIRCS
jgi:hypothetical protein